jgi:tyrosyl-tRNA synthetase
MLTNMLKVDAKKIEEILTRGVEDVVDIEHLKKRLLAGEKLRVKHGLDPTGPKIHLGRATQFWKLKEFQDLGHQVVLIIGDFTGQIGDASDKQAMRRALSEKEVKLNMKDYVKQIGRALDVKKVELHYNNEWSKKMTAKDLLKLAMKFTAQQMIQRRNFKERWDEGKEIGLHELTYPLFQGYDSVAIRADLELGGTDQLFNLLAGRKIQESFNQLPQDIITLKMLDGLDGRKMSTSWGNVVNIADSADEMYGKVMSMHDQAILQYFELCTKVPMSEIKEMERKMRFGANPKNYKAQLALEIVKLYHGERAAKDAEKKFNKVFINKETPEDIRTETINRGQYKLVDLLFQYQLAVSKGEAGRLIAQGGVEINGEVVSDRHLVINIDSSKIIKVGKRRFLRLDTT